MSMLKDKSGKLSSKRVLGTITISVGLVMAILMFFFELGANVEGSLILGILGIGFGAIGLGTFERKE